MSIEHLINKSEAHDYPHSETNTTFCKFGCGCWVGPGCRTSGGPAGINPLGKCPMNNPEVFIFTGNLTNPRK
jgi:hypothetical protein